MDTRLLGLAGWHLVFDAGWQRCRQGLPRWQSHDMIGEELSRLREQLMCYFERPLVLLPCVIRAGLFALLLSLGLAPPAAAGPLEDAVAAYERGLLPCTLHAANFSLCASGP